MTIYKELYEIMINKSIKLNEAIAKNNQNIFIKIIFVKFLDYFL